MSDRTEVMTATEVAQALRVSRQTAYGLFDSGEIKGFKVGHHRRYFKDSVEAFMQSGPREVIPINEANPSLGKGFEILRSAGYDYGASQGSKGS